MKRLAVIAPTEGGIEALLSYGNNELAFSPSGKYVAVVYGPYFPTLAKGQVVVWDLRRPAAPREHARLDGQECVAFAASAELAYGGEHAVEYFDGSVKRRVEVPSSNWAEHPRRLAFAPSGRLAVGQVRTLAIVEASGEVHALPNKHQATIRALAWSADERFLYSLDDSYLRVWDAAKGEQIKRVAIKGYQLARAPGGLITNGLRVELHPLGKNGIPGKARVLLREQVQRFALRPDGRALAIATEDELRIQTLDGSRAPPAIRQVQRWPTLAFSPDGKLLAVVEHGTLSLYDPT